MNGWFEKIKLVCSMAAILLFVWINCQVWIPGFGGPFPHRTRGPLAKHEYYQLSDMEDWENFLRVPGTGQSTGDLLIQAQPLPILELTKPDEPLPPQEIRNPIQKDTDE